MWWIITFFIYSVQVPTVNLHAFHVSKCEIEYNRETGSFEMSLHMFLDDLELALKEQGADNLYLCTPKEIPEAKDLLINYIRQKLKLFSGINELQFEFIGKEISNDLAAVWCYMEFLNVPLQSEIRIENSVLLELFDDQKNITSLKISKDLQKYFLFDKREHSAKISL